MSQITRQELQTNLNSQIPYYGTATSADEKLITIASFAGYIDGIAISFKNATANTDSVTLNVNGLGAKPVIKSDGKQLTLDELKANSIYTVRYNSTTGNFILQGEGGGVGITEKQRIALNSAINGILGG